MSNFKHLAGKELQETLGITDLDEDLRAFILEVYHMREAQRGFFTHYGSEWKQKRVTWESRVDKKIASFAPALQRK